MKRIWAISTIRPLLEHERTEAMLLGLSCPCGPDVEVTHDITRRYLTADGTRETGVKVCSQCLLILQNDIMFDSTRHALRRKGQPG